jgi:hypothetical protein
MSGPVKRLSVAVAAPRSAVKPLFAASRPVEAPFTASSERPGGHPEWSNAVLGAGAAA